MPFPPTFTDVWDHTTPPDTQLLNQGALDFRNLKSDIEQRLSLLSGTLANRPTPETVNATWGGVGFGLLYFATDTGHIYQWTGSPPAWVDVTSTFASVASSLKTTGSPVVVSGSAPPSAGQVLEATSATVAAWTSLPAIPSFNDQTAANGYFDIGKLRMQWGAGTATGSGNTAGTFPTSFVHVWAINLTIASNFATLSPLTIAVLGTSSFTVSNVNSSSLPFWFIAFGSNV